MMLPIMLVAILFGIVFTVTDIIIILVLTRGGSYDSTQVLVSRAFYTGVGAAVSIPRLRYPRSNRVKGG